MIMPNNEIVVRDIISEDLVLRSIVSNLFKEINTARSKDIILNFKGTKFMSRSFAQEYLDLKSKSKKAIKERNMPVEIKKMLNVVETSKPKAILNLKTISMSL